MAFREQDRVRHSVDRVHALYFFACCQVELQSKRNSVNVQCVERQENVMMYSKKKKTVPKSEARVESGLTPCGEPRSAARARFRLYLWWLTRTGSRRFCDELCCCQGHPDAQLLALRPRAVAPLPPQSECSRDVRQTRATVGVSRGGGGGGCGML